MPLRTNGARLRELRLLKGLTARAFAEQAGFTHTYVSQVECGHSNAGPRFLAAAAQILGCEISDITNGVLPRRRTERQVTR